MRTIGSPHRRWMCRACHRHAVTLGWELGALGGRAESQHQRRPTTLHMAHLCGVEVAVGLRHVLCGRFIHPFGF